MGDTDFSAALARLERAICSIEANADLLAKRITGGGATPAEQHLRAEVASVIDELNAMIGEPGG